MGGLSDGWYLIGDMPRSPGYEGAIINLRPVSFGDGPRARIVAADGKSGEYATIQAAINAATGGDEVVLLPGTLYRLGQSRSGPVGQGHHRTQSGSG